MRCYAGVESPPPCPSVRGGEPPLRRPPRRRGEPAECPPDGGDGPTGNSPGVGLLSVSDPSARTP